MIESPKEETKKPVLIAFYGSLMQGSPPFLGAQKNIPELKGNIRFVRECEVVGLLYDLGEYPALVETQITEGTPRVKAELYEVLTPDTLLLIDEYEGYYPEAPELSYYLRKSVQITNAPLDAWCYFYNESIEDKRLIKSGCWRTHSASKRY